MVQFDLLMFVWRFTRIQQNIFGIGAMTVDILMTDNNNGLNFDEFCTVWISRISRTKSVQLWDMDACQNWVPQELDGYSTLQTTNKRIRLQILTYTPIYALLLLVTYGASISKGTPKSSIWCSIINHPAIYWGTPMTGHFHLVLVKMTHLVQQCYLADQTTWFHHGRLQSPN